MANEEKGSICLSIKGSVGEEVIVRSNDKLTSIFAIQNIIPQPQNYLDIRYNDSLKICDNKFV